MKFDLHRRKICPFESVVIKYCTLHRCKSDENKTLPTRTNFSPSPHFHDCRNNGSKICYPHVTSALAELKGISLSFDERRRNQEKSGGVSTDVIALSQRFAMLMAEYHQSIEDGVITINEAKRLLKETLALQQVLIDMKLHLEDEAG